jgi:hypothetical protein
LEELNKKRRISNKESWVIIINEYKERLFKKVDSKPDFFGIVIMISCMHVTL